MFYAITTSEIVPGLHVSWDHVTGDIIWQIYFPIFDLYIATIFVYFYPCLKIPPASISQQ